jgi:predicted nucleic acid-binding protein
MYLLDTNIISENFRKQPNKGVLAWLGSVAMDQTRISSVSLGELCQGIHQLNQSKRKTELETWYANTRATYLQRVIAADDVVFECWAEEMEKLKRIGRTPQILDALIAATALTYNLVMVTRNVDDFSIFKLEIINPFELS